MSQAPRRPVIVMQTGPIHLFWATGVFYFWELKERFDFVFLVSENYRDDERFKKLLTLSEVLHVDYAPSAGRWVQHRHCARGYRDILSRYRPDAVLLYNQSYPDNLYLTHYCDEICPNVVRYCYQLGRMPIDWEADFSGARAEAISKFASRYSIFERLPTLAHLVYAAKIRLSFWIDYKLFPFLTIYKTFSPPLNVHTGGVDKRAMRAATAGPRDRQLTYTENDQRGYLRLGFGNVYLVRHPASRIGDAVFRFLYGDFAARESIVILPSFAPSSLTGQGLDKDEVVLHVSTLWNEALATLLAVFPGYHLKIKLHPTAVDDPVWQKIIEKMIGRFPNLEVVPVKESAEWHIVQAKVVVGEVTSALWWTAMCGGKTVISLDIFGYPGGDDMRHYPGNIHYFSSLDLITRLRDLGPAGGFLSAPSVSETIV